MAGRLRLAVTGVQDQWLTGDPKISYFSSIYKRHTRFSTEAVGIPITGNVSLGGNAIARIPNNVGDLLRSVMLKLTLGELPSGNLYNASVATSVIQYVDLVIGGQTIQRLTGDYIDMYNQLHSNKDDADTTLYYMNGHNNQIQIVSAPRTFYLNLPFYFFRNPSLAIPICAITRQLIEIHIKFKDVDDDVTFSYEEVNGNMVRTKTELGSIVEASIITDFYFITRDEINFLLTRPMQYIITQLQLSTMQFKPNESKKSALLKFTNPVKELFFSAKEETGANVGNEDRLLDVTSTDQAFSNHVTNKRSDYRFVKNIRFECNGKRMFDHTGKYLAYEQSLIHHTGCPDPAYEFYTYSFALKPELYYPTGQLNMSRIIHKKLDVELDETSTSRNINFSIYALNYNLLHVEGGLAGLKF
jgi:hypothetical protein